MKRDKNLQQLSRDHHHGLLLGWKIRQGLKYLADPEEIAAYVNYFSEEALLPHFEEEEKCLLIYLPDDDRLKQRALQEHKTITGLIDKLAVEKNTEPAALLNIAELLSDHIRFEERELFPYLEGALSTAQLEEAAAAIDTAHQPFIENYPNQFWTRC